MIIIKEIILIIITIAVIITIIMIMVYSIGSPRDGSSSIKTIQSLTVRINQNELKLIAIEK